MASSFSTNSSAATLADVSSAGANGPAAPVTAGTSFAERCRRCGECFDFSYRNVYTSHTNTTDPHYGTTGAQQQGSALVGGGFGGQGVIGGIPCPGHRCLLT